MYLRSSWHGLYGRTVCLVDWVTVVLAVLVVSALDGFDYGCFVESVADLLLLIDLLVIWGQDYLTSVWTGCNGEEELQASGWTHSARLKPFTWVIEKHLNCCIILMLEMNEAIHTLFISLCKLLYFLIVRQIEVLLLPTMTDPAHITHVSSLELVVLVRL